MCGAGHLRSLPHPLCPGHLGAPRGLMLSGLLLGPWPGVEARGLLRGLHLLELGPEMREGSLCKQHSQVTERGGGDNSQVTRLASHLRPASPREAAALPPSAEEAWALFAQDHSCRQSPLLLHGLHHPHLSWLRNTPQGCPPDLHPPARAVCLCHCHGVPLCIASAQHGGPGPQEGWEFCMPGRSRPGKGSSRGSCGRPAVPRAPEPTPALASSALLLSVHLRPPSPCLWLCPQCISLCLCLCRMLCLWP